MEGGEDALAFIKLENLWLVLVEAERRQAGSLVEVLWLYTFNKPQQHMHASVWDPYLFITWIRKCEHMKNKLQALNYA